MRRRCMLLEGALPPCGGRCGRVWGYGMRVVCARGKYVPLCGVAGQSRIGCLVSATGPAGREPRVPSGGVQSGALAGRGAWTGEWREPLRRRVLQGVVSEGRRGRESAN